MDGWIRLWMEKLMDLYLDFLVIYARSLLPDIMKDEAEDFVQQGFYKLYRHTIRGGNIPTNGKERAYLIAIVRNEIYSYLRSKRGQEQMNSTVFTYMTENVTEISAEDAYIEVSENTDKKNQLLLFIAYLPERQRTAIELRVFAQQEYRDIARMMGISESGVRSHVSNGIARLKEMLHEERSDTHDKYRG